jgi:WD40 repeat protein
VRARLVTSDDHTVELAHESLARAWPRLRSWLDDDVEGQRILRHLALAADTWDTMDRPDSELYRGVRLAQALDWQTTSEPDLTPAERAFLDTSAERERAEAESTEQQLRHRTRQNRRLRALLAGAAVLLVVAFVAGLLAVRQADRADRATIAAEARRVGAQALVADDIDQSLLLAVEGLRLDDSTDTRANLLAALDRSPELIGSIRGGYLDSGQLVADSSQLEVVGLSADGSVVAVGVEGGTVDGGFALYDVATRALIKDHTDLISTFAFHPSDNQLAIAYYDGPNPFEPRLLLVDARTLEEQVAQLDGMPLGEGAIPVHLSYSADGGSLAVAFERLVEQSSTISIWDLASPDEPVRTAEVAGFADVALSADGHLAYVGTIDPPTLAIYEVETGRQLESVDVAAGEIEVDPGSTRVAVATGRDVELFDAVTLAPTLTLSGHADRVSALRFSHDGVLLASGSDDGDVIVWDVASGVPREHLTGHTEGPVALDFSGDDTTLYTAGFDGALLIWDLAGNQRFIAQPVAAQPGPVADHALGNPSGTIVAYIASGDIDSPADLLRFRAVDSGQLSNQIDTQQSYVADLAWRPNGQQLATVDFGLVQIWDAVTASLVTGKLVTTRGVVADLDYTPDGDRLMVAEGRDRTGEASIFMLDAETLEPAGKPVALNEPIVAASAGPGGRFVIAVAKAGGYAVVDLVDGVVVHEGQLGLDPFDVDLSPDGQRAVVIGTNGEVGILDVADGEWVAPPIQASPASVGFASYTPDGQSVVVGSRNGVASLWDGRIGQLLGHVTASPTSAFVRPTMLDDGYTAMLTGRDGAVYMWDTRAENWVEAACAIAGRNLTDDEWRDAFGDRPYRLTCPDQAAPDPTAES